MPKYFDPTRADHGREEIFAFWQGLQANTGASAALRRAWTPLDVLLVPQFHDLRAKLAAKEIAYDVSSLAVAVAIAARIRRNIGIPLGRAAHKHVTQRRMMSTLAAESHDEVIVAFARLLPLLKDGLDVCDAAWAVYRISHPSLRDSVIADIAEDFYSPARLAD